MRAREAQGAVGLTVCPCHPALSCMGTMHPAAMLPAFLGVERSTDRLHGWEQVLSAPSPLLLLPVGSERAGDTGEWMHSFATSLLHDLGHSHLHVGCEVVNPCRR